MGGRRALLLAAASSALLFAACGKSRRPAPPLVWHLDVDDAYAEGRRLSRPVLLFFGATWDTASKELEYRTFPDPEIASRLATEFVLVHVDCSDDELETTQRLARRYDIKGTPSMIVVDPTTDRELARFTEFVPPERLAPALDRARAEQKDLAQYAIVPLLHFRGDIDGGMREAIARRRPVFLFFGPAYDHGSKQVRESCFGHPRIARILHDDLVLVDVWSNEGANEHWDRFSVRGSPTSIVIDPAKNRELGRVEAVVSSIEYTRFLRDALTRFRA